MNFVYFELSDTYSPFDSTVLLKIFNKNKNERKSVKIPLGFRELSLLLKGYKVFLIVFFSNEYRNIQKSSIVDIKITSTYRNIILICYYYNSLRVKNMFSPKLVFMKNNITLKYTHVSVGLYY